MKPKIIKSKRKTLYYPPELMPFVYSSACLGIVLDENEEAAALYDEIVECYKLPGWTQLFDKIDEETPDWATLMKTVVELAGYDFYNPPTRANMGIPYIRGLFKGFVRFASQYSKRFLFWGLKDKNIRADIMLPFFKMNELIKQGFNNKADIEKGKYRLKLESSPWIVNAIIVHTMLEHFALRMPKIDKMKVIKIKGRIYTMGDISNGKAPTRFNRNLAKEYKGAGFLMKYPDSVDETAWVWFQCRVLYSGPEEYCRRLLLKKGITLDSGNVSNQIKVCDEAVGYSRKRTSKGDGVDQDHFLQFYELVNRARGVLRKKKKK